MDSPRGRLHLMQAEVDGRVSFDASVVRRMDACLGCLACVTACPSGVEYGPLIEATRGEIERSFDRPIADRVFRQLLFAVLPYPARLRALGHGLGLALRVRSVLERLGWLERLPARAREHGRRHGPLVTVPRSLRIAGPTSPRSASATPHRSH